MANAFVFDAMGALRAIDLLNKLGGFYPPEKRQVEFPTVILRTQQAGKVYPKKD